MDDGFLALTRIRDAMAQESAQTAAQASAQDEEDRYYTWAENVFKNVKPEPSIYFMYIVMHDSAGNRRRHYEPIIRMI